MGTPVSQLLLEWDAAKFNAAVEAHDEAMATITARLKSLVGNERTGEQVNQLRAQRRKIKEQMIERSKLFWKGRSEDGS